MNNVSRTALVTLVAATLAASLLTGCSEQDRERHEILSSTQVWTQAALAPLDATTGDANRADDADKTDDAQKTTPETLASYTPVDTSKFGAGVDIGFVRKNGPENLNTKMAFRPASLAKHNLTASAQETHRTDFRFETRLSYDVSSDNLAAASGLTIEGEGDPTSFPVPIEGETPLFSSVEHLVQIEDIPKALQEDGIGYLFGPVRIGHKDERWKEMFYPQGFAEENKPTCYGSIPQSINVNVNCGTFDFSKKNASWVNRGLREEVQFQPSSDPQAGLVRKFDVANWPHLILEAGAQASSTRARLPVYAPHLWLKELVHSAIGESGIQRMRPEEENYHLKNTQSHEKILYSSRLPQLLGLVNRDSENFVADALFRAVAAKVDAESQMDLLSLAQVQMQYFLRKALGEESHAVQLFDGSGLSYDDSITPQALFQFLNWVQKQSYWSNFLGSMAVAGKDGTLAHRFAKARAKGWVRAKTGTLDGYFQLAGYVPRIKNGKAASWLPFVLLTHATEGTAGAKAKSIQDVQDEVVEQIFQQINPQE
jgi:D-alanyl-D-alanine carboxypeptidase/D-alanyl-D-alanine-endopeptidase (penicillin-binding protein 4)